MKKILATIVAAVCAAFGAFAATINLDDVQSNIMVHDGDVLTGNLIERTPMYIPKILIEAGATVTISNTVIHGHTYAENVLDLGDGGFNNDWAGITCAGRATIILCATNVVRGCQTAPAIYIPEGYSLTIKGDGKLAAYSGGLAAAIGGGYRRPCGNIYIQGGKISAYGVDQGMFRGGGAGIGGGSQSSCGDIVISGGELDVGAVKGAGIGSGPSGLCGNITISGGEVISHFAATGQPGIGSGENGECGWIEITGGDVGVSGGNGAAGIGSGREAVCGDIDFRGGKITAYGGAGGAGVGSGVEGTCGTTRIWTGISRVKITRGDKSAGIMGPGSNGTSPTAAWVQGAGLVRTQPNEDTFIFMWDGNLATRTCDVIAYDGMELYGTLSGNYKVSIAAGATVTLNGITINGVNNESYEFAGLNLLGDATLILADGKSNTVKGFERNYPGVYVPPGHKLTIAGSGTLTASSNGFGAGIGGGFEIDCGDIDINGGIITATGGTQAAGIGGGGSANHGTIKINAGIRLVTATGGNLAAPIGNGNDGTGGNVTIDSGLRNEFPAGTNKRIISPVWDGDLSKLIAGEEVTAYDGMTIFGRMTNKAKVSIAAGAWVTLRSVDITFDGSDANCPWAGLTCKGNATLILEGVNWVQGFRMNYPGIYVPPNKTLTIKGGGTLNAYGNDWGAGIGGGYQLACGNIDIQGGFIDAYGETRAAGIGGGYEAACGSIHIAASVAKVRARSGENAVRPIGAGNNGTGGNVTVDSGVKDETSTDGRTRTITWNGDLSNLTGDMEAVNGTVIHGTLSGKYKVSIAADASVTLSNAVIRGVNDVNCPWAGLTCEGHATITLAGDNEINGFYKDSPGIYVPEGKTLTINGSGTATLFASSIYGAGIGGGAGQACGNLNIQSGIITAVGGGYSAGIGSGRGQACGTIAISPSVTRVMATCGNNATSPIGAGYGGSSGTITVNGVGTTLTDTTSGKTRTICWNGDLSLTSGDGRTAFHGMTLYKSLASGALRKFDIEAGATVTISNATINGTDSTDAKWAGLTCKGDATINLVGSSTVKGFYYDYPGIHVPTNATLTIRGDGSLTASSNGYGAGIGGGYQVGCGDIAIESGTITATGGDRAAGIGGGAYTKCGTITIGQGITRVTATCGNNTNLKPIGPGTAGSGGEVVLDGVFEDVTSGTTRTITPAWDGNLSTLDHNVTAVNGTVIHGTLAGQYKVSIAAGATVTLSNATITCGNNNGNYGWAGLTCLGSATIILKKTNIVKGFYEDYPGIHVPEGKMLVIQGTGTLTASSNGYGAGIGGGFNIACGDIAVMSGTIEATGGKYSAGIGGSHDSECGNIYIGGVAPSTYGGAAVTATGGVNGAGIGSGGQGGSCGNIMIVGSETQVTATGGTGGAGIGSGNGEGSTCGTITLYAGMIVANGGAYAAGIGCGFNTSSSGVITIVADSTATTRVTAICGTGAATPIGAEGGATCDGVSVAASLYDDHGSPTRFISAEFPWDGNLSTLDHDATARDGTVIHGTLGGSHKVSIADGATVTISNAVINADGSLEGSFAGLTCEGNATIVLLGENTVKAFHNFYPGIYVPANMTLTIQGTGSLTANVHSGDSWAAGIGGGYSYGSVYLNCGNVVIAGGTVVANGGFRSAGIGGGYRSNCGDIAIGSGIKSVVATRGTVDVEGFVVEAIGAGFDGNRGTVTVDSSLYDDDGDPTRTIMKDPPWDGNLATLTRDATAQNGTVIYGTLAGNYKVSIADGATVTLSNAVINADGSLTGAWAGLTCLGDATIVLAAGSESVVKAFNDEYPGIHVPTGYTLTIQGTGSLTASAKSAEAMAAGIGGGCTTSFSQINCGSISIEGGTVIATGGTRSAGIGSAYRGTCGDITIGAGITRVVATRGYVEDGIEDPVEPIGAGLGGNRGTVTVDSSLNDDNGSPTRTITQWVWDGNLATLTRNAMARDGTVIHGTLAGNYKVYIADGATVTLSNANVNAGCSLSGTWAGLTCAGDATIILADGSVNTVYGFYDESTNYGDYPGLYVPVGSTLTIAGTGTLNAHGDGAGVRTCQAAGIGGGFEIPCGNIVIAGGTINAYGGSNSAGIGGGYHASCGTISITGGNVTAKNVQSAAGIGSGYNGSCGTITIGSGIVRVVAKSRRMEGQYGEPVGKCLYGTSVTVNVDPALTKTEEDTEENYLFYKVWTYEPTASGSYAAWATANGVSGAWDAVDANGIANVFRYAFNKPTGLFTDPVLLDITFNEQGKAVILTPPLVNGAGFTFTIGASDNVDGTGNAASYQLNASGETVIDETGKSTRFFRLRAVTQ